MLDIKQLRELVRLMTANDLTELDLQGKDGERVTLKRGSTSVQPQVIQTQTPVLVPPTTTPMATAPAVSVKPVDEGPTINSPMVGTFYASPTPDAKPFVAVGASVSPDTVVCIIEAMKVFNEIRAETTGVVVKVLVENGQAVEFGQPLFVVKPA